MEVRASFSFSFFLSFSRLLEAVPRFPDAPLEGQHHYGASGVAGVVARGVKRERGVRQGLVVRQGRGRGDILVEVMHEPLRALAAAAADPSPHRTVAGGSSCAAAASGAAYLRLGHGWRRRHGESLLLASWRSGYRRW